MGFYRRSGIPDECLLESVDMNLTPYVLGAVAAGFVTLAVAYQIRLRRKRGLSRDEFAAVFQREGVPYKIAAAVYDYYSSFAGSRGYAVSPDDTYDGLLLESDEDVLDDAKRLVKQLRMRLPDETTSPVSASLFKTVRDMVLWLDWVRQHQAQPTVE